MGRLMSQGMGNVNEFSQFKLVYRFFSYTKEIFF